MAPKRRSAKEPTRLRVNVAIDADLRRRLGAYVGAHRCTEAHVVERALERELTGFFYGQREPRSGVTPEAPESGENPEILALRTA